MTNSDDRTVSEYTQRRERTLPARPAADDDVDAAPGSGSVLALSLPGPRPDENGSEPVPDTAATTEDPPASLAPGPGPGDGETAQNERPGRWTGAGRTFAKIVAWTAAFPVLCILPFLVVLRISVLAYQESTYDGWQSLVIGILAALLLVSVCIAAFMWTFGIRRRFYMPLLNVCLTAMLCYSGFALFHLAVSNAKTAEIRSYYTSLHPFLRIAVKNLTILDEDLVVTDVRRTREEYREMGLPPRDYSLHFKQPTGFVHAVDIRTVGRSRITNLMVELYFVLMGFETIRHVGTADHLHVALPLADAD
ncbi:MAG: hypothetical protein U5R46_06310 [Gammaproteobacteria bacterium]|nr:hypothetical protein [Gammaproteobacteria bacterium]